MRWQTMFTLYVRLCREKKEWCHVLMNERGFDVPPTGEIRHRVRSYEVGGPTEASRPAIHY